MQGKNHHRIQNIRDTIPIDIELWQNDRDRFLVPY